ncbi:AAA family ATPase [Nocardia asteroides]
MQYHPDSIEEQGERAEYVPGGMAVEQCWIDEQLTGHNGRLLCTVTHEDTIREVFGVDAARLVSELYTRLRADYRPVELGDVPALPAEVLPESMRPTRAEVLAYCQRTRTTDADAYIAELERRAAATESDPDGSPESAVFDFARDFAALRAPEMLIPRLIETGSAVQIIAEPNQGKTFLAVSWACSLAVAGKSVVYVVADDSTYQFVRRVLGWCAAHDVEPREVFAHLHLFTRAAHFADDADMDAVVGLVQANDAVLVVFDTQHQCSDGVQENSNDDSRMITAACKRLTAMNVAVALVHHTGDGKTGRGAKSMHGYLTTVLVVKDVTKDRARYLEVSTAKQKNAARADPVLFPFGAVEIPAEMRGTVIPERDAWTLVAHTITDRFDSPHTDRATAIATVRRYGVLWALHSSPVPLPLSRIAKFTRERATPMLGSRNLLSAKGQRPRGFSDGDISALLMSMKDAELVDDTAESTGKSAYYELTSKGRTELADLTEALDVEAGNGN